MKTQRMCIPAVGTSLVLAEPWTFLVANEYRNKSLVEALGKLSEDARYGWPLGLDGRTSPEIHRRTPKTSTLYCTLPAGSVLRVDRVYIRKSGPDMARFNSLSFLAVVRGKKVRFFASLGDVNTMVVRVGALS